MAALEMQPELVVGDHGVALNNPLKPIGSHWPRTGCSSSSWLVPMAWL